MVEDKIKQEIKLTKGEGPPINQTGFSINPSRYNSKLFGKQNYRLRKTLPPRPKYQKQITADSVKRNEKRTIKFNDLIYCSKDPSNLIEAYISAPY